MFLCSLVFKKNMFFCSHVFKKNMFFCSHVFKKNMFFCSYVSSKKTCSYVFHKLHVRLSNSRLRGTVRRPYLLRFT